MLATSTPFQAYRSVEFDAHVAGSGSAELVLLCIDDVAAAISRSIWAHRRGEAKLRNSCLQRAANGLAALQLGVDRESQLADGLLTLYSAMARCVTSSLSAFEPANLSRVLDDLRDLSRQFRQNIG